MNYHEQYRFSFVALTVVGIWFCIIMAWLYSPVVINYFRPSNSITIFIPPLFIDPHVIERFEKEKGIKVYTSYFETSTALVSKITASGGTGYDIILSDDHSLEILHSQQLLQEVNSAQVPFYDQIDPMLHGVYHDPALRYTLPYCSIMYGVAYNVPFFEQHHIPIPESWSLVFNPAPLLKNRIAMNDDARELFMIACLYEYGTIASLQKKQVQDALVQLLRHQKQYVDVYSLERADYLLHSNDCTAAIMVSSDFWRLKNKYADVAFMVPKEGTFMGIYSFAIPHASKKQELAYQLLAYLFENQVLAHHMNMFGYMPAIKKVAADAINKPLSAHDYDDRPILFFSNVVPDSVFNDLWVRVLS